MRYLDLTRTLQAGMPVYPGDPAVVIKPSAQLPRVTEIALGTHAGTHLDAPLHMLAAGSPMSAFNLEKFFCRGVLLDARGQAEVGPEVLGAKQVRPGDAVLIYTGWEDQWGKPFYFDRHPVLSEDMALALSALKINIVGLDAPSPDREPYLVHKRFLESEILVLENLCNLGGLVNVPEFELIALPLSLASDGAPARVVAKTL